MKSEGRVVVLVSPTMLTKRSTGMYAARILELGLTAYDKTHDEALQKVKRMFASAVQAHRELGTLRDWLDRSGLNWFWEAEYKGAVPVEDVNPAITGNVNKVGKIPSKFNSVSSWRSVREPLPMAA